MDRRTKFFNAGLLPNNIDELRIQQGLLPLKPSNLCAFNNLGGNSYKAGKPIQLYPTYQTPQPTYDLKPIKSLCNCDIYTEPY